MARVTTVAGSAPGRRYHDKEASSRRGMSVVAHGKKEDAARRALQGALGGSGDLLAENDGGGGLFGGFFGPGGRGGGDWWGWRDRFRSWGNAGTIFFFILLFVLFKPVTAILVNLVYFVMGWPLDTPPLVASGPGVAADADIIARYGADDDDEDEDEEDE